LPESRQAFFSRSLTIGEVFDYLAEIRLKLGLKEPGAGFGPCDHYYSPLNYFDSFDGLKVLIPGKDSFAIGFCYRSNQNVKFANHLT